MGKFAKIIEIDNDEQVLLISEYNNEDDTFDVCITTDVDGTRAQIKLSFEDQDKPSEVIKSYSKEQAITFRKEMEVMLL